uniref:Uncharacterized protein n=2 Tax=Candidatus Kentrum sp. FM TaxID=2126340 RepID=A0A450VMJ7_9GAMM|nr:MAG: hypothetical protein BECKFM1743B_GA0114221_100082 [Candidatus Kentron sp. FM]
MEGVNQSVISRRLRREGEVTPSRKYLHPVATFGTARSHLALPDKPYPSETIPWDSCSWPGLGQIALWFTPRHGRLPTTSVILYPLSAVLPVDLQKKFRMKRLSQG